MSRAKTNHNNPSGISEARQQLLKFFPGGSPRQHPTEPTHPHGIMGNPPPQPPPHTEYRWPDSKRHATTVFQTANLRQEQLQARPEKPHGHGRGVGLHAAGATCTNRGAMESSHQLIPEQGPHSRAAGVMGTPITPLDQKKWLSEGGPLCDDTGMLTPGWGGGRGLHSCLKGIRLNGYTLRRCDLGLGGRLQGLVAVTPEVCGRGDRRAAGRPMRADLLSGFYQGGTRGGPASGLRWAGSRWQFGARE
ncbi:hypothetical protein AAFF_G00397620 [Aldrovandia affinis]|uniref:Uncharacterized protein n=1 Tax=Aldrovandia affinis TaxID=143900 RepID=A0AAD7WLE7_9TELE|nr:hypothetical protein AAFF_G00397620 [Aldrovandia affinis]